MSEITWWDDDNYLKQDINLNRLEIVRYNKKNWVDGGEPAIDADSLNAFDNALASLLGTDASSEGYLDTLVDDINPVIDLLEANDAALAERITKLREDLDEEVKDRGEADSTHSSNIANNATNIANLTKRLQWKATNDSVSNEVDTDYPVNFVICNDDEILGYTPSVDNSGKLYFSFVDNTDKGRLYLAINEKYYRIGEHLENLYVVNNIDTNELNVRNTATVENTLTVKNLAQVENLVVNKIIRSEKCEIIPCTDDTDTNEDPHVAVSLGKGCQAAHLALAFGEDSHAKAKYSVALGYHVGVAEGADASIVLGAGIQNGHEVTDHTVIMAYGVGDVALNFSQLKTTREHVDIGFGRYATHNFGANHGIIEKAIVSAALNNGTINCQGKFNTVLNEGCIVGESVDSYQLSSNTAVNKALIQKTESNVDYWYNFGSGTSKIINSYCAFAANSAQLTSATYSAGFGTSIIEGQYNLGFGASCQIKTHGALAGGQESIVSAYCGVSVGVCTQTPEGDGHGTDGVSGAAAFGHFNTGKYLFEIGNGSGAESEKRSNAFSVSGAGNGIFAGTASATVFIEGGNALKDVYQKIGACYLKTESNAIFHTIDAHNTYAQYVEDTYYTKTYINNTFLTKTDAANIYFTQANHIIYAQEVRDTFLTKTDAENIYFTKDNHEAYAEEVRDTYATYEYVDSQDTSLRQEFEERIDEIVQTTVDTAVATIIDPSNTYIDTITDATMDNILDENKDNLTNLVDKMFANPYLDSIEDKLLNDSFIEKLLEKLPQWVGGTY